MSIDATKLYKIGDPIEVRYVDRNNPGEDSWRPATVGGVGAAYVVAVYHDGKRHTVQPKHVRPADVH